MNNSQHLLPNQTGKGTGLGLSLSYDIVKVFEDEIKVKTKGGEGTQFTIILRES